MPSQLVDTHRLEFLSRPRIAEAGEQRGWPARQWAEGLRAWKLETSQSVSAAARGWSLGPHAVALAAGAAALGSGGLYWWITRPGWTSGAPAGARLALATVIGLVVTAAHMCMRSHRSGGLSLARAQTLLCVAGALTMILIDNSVARAFGIAGAASIVRFRTPVDDPTDATVMFLLMALGMASGIGAFGLAVAGAAGVSGLLIAFGTFAPEPRRRSVTVDFVGTRLDFPSSLVHRVFARYGVPIEPCEWSRDTVTRMKFRASVDEAVSLESLGSDLMVEAEGGLESVRWEVRKNGN